MKNTIYTASFILLTLLFSSCGINNAMLLNVNQSATQVHLTSNNFKVVDKVRGSAEVPYILLIGGISRKQLYANAYADMLEKANLLGSAKAIINIVTEEHLGGVPPFYMVRTVTVSANVIEFQK
ncbi:MAG: DUF6567 family protein [Cyclobacteriaceae bacterium]|jgi:hypothetical protein